ncbi:MAG TPA: hypothetical protein VG963_29655, partial [Polyangiaceae bacterium]|nr:hypothetical protein [Polyangiaceae bacterium]
MRATIAEWCFNLYRLVLPVAQLGFLVALSVFVPACLIRRPRGWAADGLLYLSYAFGVTLWLLSAGIAFASFGWLGLMIGLFLLAVGVVPLAIFAAFFKLDAAPIGWSLLAMVAIVYGSRLLALRTMGRIADEQSTQQGGHLPDDRRRSATPDVGPFADPDTT